MVIERTACPLDCPDGCSLEVEIDGGRLVRVDAVPTTRASGDRTVNALTQGFICHKVKHHAERVYGPDRVLTPLVRTGAKGDGRFRSASWDEALDLVVDRLTAASERHGPETVVPFLYNSSGGMLAKKGLTPLLWRAFGASEVERTICAKTAGAAWDLTFGTMPGADPLTIAHSRLVVAWGANPAISSTHVLALVARARRDNGAAFVVVDPRLTGAAHRADLHLPVLPGTDVVLAMATARVLHERGAIDRDFVGEHADGVEGYLAACDEWTLDRASRVCGVEPDGIEALADLLGDPRRHPKYVRVGYGMERNRNGGSAHRAVLALAVLVGAFGRLGSGVHLHTDHSIGWDADALSRAVLGDHDDPTSSWRPRGRVLNQNRIGADLLDVSMSPPISVLFVQGANPAVMAPAQTKVLAGLARDDLFTVVHDQVMTDTARFADVVLPATTHFELEDVSRPYGAFAGERIRAVIGRVGESRTNDEVAAALAVRLGFPADAFDPSPQRLLGVALGASGGEPVPDPPGRVQFADVFPDFSHLPRGGARGCRARLVADASGIDPTPVYRELRSPLPLTLITPADRHTTNSIFGERGEASTQLVMNPADAHERGITDGSPIRVWGVGAELTTEARLDPDVRDGVVVLPKGLWHRALPDRLNGNAFTPDALADLGGGATFHDARVDVEPTG